MNNPTLEFLRKTREALLAEAGGTLEGLVRRLQADEKSSGRLIFKSPESKSETGTPKPGDSIPKNLLPSSEYMDQSVPKLS